MDAQQVAEEAKLAFEKGKIDQAIQGFSDALAGFEQAGDAPMAAEMQSNLCVALLRKKKPAEALAAVQGTADVFAAIGDLRRQGMALANLASALQALKRRDEAVAAYQESARILDQAGETEMRTSVYQSLAAMDLGKGDLVDAVVDMQSGYMGLKKPTLLQRIMRKLLFMRR